MKTCIVVSLVLFCSIVAEGQTSAVQLFHDKILYLNTDNPLTIVAEGYPCKSLTVSINNGTIKGRDGHYIAHPDSLNYNTIITIKAKTPKGIIELPQQYFWVRRLPGQIHGEVDSSIKR
ncbi:GldM family protein [Flavipsychrobacter stenotrophus]|nr:GldM family protein [Flavipsychrobacter stenotrophus]